MNILDSTKLAILGGKPIRTRPYPKHTTQLGDEEKREVIATLDDGELSGFSGWSGPRFLGGARVRQLEADLCVFFGVQYAVTFNSATSALHASLVAAGIGPGDEVIVSPYSMVASATCVLMCNAIPVFADVEPDMFCLDPASVEMNITAQTRAILTVNLFGQPSNLASLSRLADQYNLVLIEDNAQSPGSQYGSMLAGTVGEMGVLSFNYHKAIQCGEGGAIITNSDELADRCRLVRNHGEACVVDMGRGEMECQLGFNYRLTELQAAVAIPQLRKLNSLTAKRQELASILENGLNAFPFLRPPIVRNECTHVYYVYGMRYIESVLGVSRDIFFKALAAEGVSVGQGYVKPLYLLPIFQKRLPYTKGCPYTCGHYSGEVSYAEGICPNVEMLYSRELLTTEICRYPNNQDDMREFVLAVEKISDQSNSLKSLA